MARIISIIFYIAMDAASLAIAGYCYHASTMHEATAPPILL